MDKIRKFLISDWFAVLTVVAGALVVITNNEVVGTLLFAILTGVVMVLTDDLLPVFQTVLITVCFAIRCKHSFDDFIQYWWLAPPIVIMVLSHFFIYRCKFSKGSLFYGILTTSVAVTLGGLGIITAKEYFSLTSLFYVFMLGFAMLIVYSYMNSALACRDTYSFSDRFAKIMVSLIIMLCICLAEEYLTRLPELDGTFDILPFQWRNNGSTILMLAMPFAFCLSAKKFGWFFVGMLSYAAILLTGSRGGMIFGLIELGFCFIVMFILDKRHRYIIACIFFVCLVIAFLMRHYLIDMVSYTLARLLNPEENIIRLQLIPRGVQDFLANPLFGRGLGYMGNSDVHNNAEFTLCWYHCSPVQVIGSFGITGILAYGFLIYLRIKTLIKNFTFFNIIVFLSYIALEMMSFVNPGIFAPFPYLFLATVFFVMIEKCNGDDDKKALSLIKSGRYGIKK